MLNVVYIGGYGRSGSTVLELDLARRFDALGAGELSSLFDWAASDRACSCSESLYACPRWGPVLQRTAQVGSPIDLAESLRLAERGSSKDVKRHGSLWVRTWSEVLSALDESDIGMVVDSSKTAGGSRRALLMAQLCADRGYPFLFVHMSRDPRGVMYSTYKGGNQDIESGAVLQPSLSRSARSAAGWFKAESRASRYRRADAIPHSVVVRYEQYVADADATMDDFERAADGAGILRGSASDNAHGIAGNRLRRKDSEPELILDDGWKHGLPIALKATGSAMNGYRSWTTRVVTR